MLHGEKMRLKYIVPAVLILGIIALVILYSVFQGNSHSSPGIRNITVGMKAPNYSFLLENGSEANVSSYRGHEVLFWFVATWCPTCAQGNSVLNGNYSFFRKRGVKIVELELYKDLGYAGQPIGEFVSSYAPDAYANGTITPGVAGYNITAAYDPEGYLDIYYLVSANGTVLYINGSPSVTLPQLKDAINASIE